MTKLGGHGGSTRERASRALETAAVVLVATTAVSIVSNILVVWSADTAGVSRITSLVVLLTSPRTLLPTVIAMALLLFVRVIRNGGHGSPARWTSAVAAVLVGVIVLSSAATFGTAVGAQRVSADAESTAVLRLVYVMFVVATLMTAAASAVLIRAVLARTTDPPEVSSP